MRGDLTPLMPERLLVALMKRDWQKGKLKWEQVWWPLWNIIPKKDCRHGLELPFVDVQLIRVLYGLVDWRDWEKDPSVPDDEINRQIDGAVKDVFATCESDVIPLPNWA